MGGGRRLLVLAAVLAVLIECSGVIGWWRWHQVLNHLREDPGSGATALADDALLRLPSVVRLARRLPGFDLVRAPADSVVAALAGLGRDQQRLTPADPRGFVNRARAMLMRGEYETAEKLLDGALLRDPTSPEAHRLAALAARALGKNENALDLVAASAGLGDGSWRNRIELTPEEIEWVHLEGLRRRLDFYPRARIEGRIGLARELRSRGEVAAGRAHLELENTAPAMILELARWDIDGGLPEAAVNRLETLTVRRGLPSSILAETWSVMAVALDRAGDRQGAVAAAETALEYDPRSPAPYRVLAGLAEGRGEMEEALEHLRRAWGMNPTDASLLLAVARTAEKADRHDDARMALERLVQVEPDEPGYRATLVEYRLRQAELMEATLDLSAALDRFPTDERLLRLADRLRAEVSRR